MMNRRSLNTYGEVICHRKLVAEKSGKEITATARIWRPIKKKENWECAFHISRIGLECPRKAYGADSFQALIMALEGIRMLLENQDIPWSWIIEKGDNSFPRFVPHGFGLDFKLRLDYIIDREISRFYKLAGRSNRGKGSEAVSNSSG